MKARICRIVEYRSRTGKYSLPAIITATTESLVLENVQAGFLPGLSSNDHVHLTVFTPGVVNDTRASEINFLVESTHGRSENRGGSYQEWDIPFDAAGSPGTWKWPDRTE